MAEVRLSSQARRDLFSILENPGEVAGLHTARKYDTDFQAAGADQPVLSIGMG